MLCPICQIELMMAERQGIEIDYCPKCRGIWLDRGELDKLVHLSDQRETYKSPVTSPREDDYDDDRYTSRESYGDEHRYPRKKKSFLSNIFDVFD